jgi:hypothetical protein
MKTYEGVELQLCNFWDLKLDGGERLASHRGRFTAGETALGGWTSPRTGLDSVEYRKIRFSYREMNPWRPACSLSLYRMNY